MNLELSKFQPIPLFYDNECSISYAMRHIGLLQNQYVKFA